MAPDFAVLSCPQRFILPRQQLPTRSHGAGGASPIRYALPGRRQQEYRQNRPNKGNSQEDRRLEEVLVGAAPRGIELARGTKVCTSVAPALLEQNSQDHQDRPSHSSLFVGYYQDS